MKPALLLVPLLFCTLISAFARDEGDLSPAATKSLMEELEQSRAKAGARRIQFRELRTSPLLVSPVEQQGELFFAAPHFLRREVRRPAPASIISNGSTLWMVYPDFQEVEIYDLSRNPVLSGSLLTLSEVLQGRRLDKSFAIRAKTTASEILLDLTPRGTARRQIRSARIGLRPDLSAAWIEMTFPDGSQTRLELHDETPFQPPAGFFDFATPPGYRESRPLG